MRTERVSTLNLSLLLRSSVMSAQGRLASAQTETVSGRYHDIGLALGARIGSDIRWRIRLEAIERQADGVKIAASRADFTQGTLGAVAELAASFMEVLTGARGSAAGQSTAGSAANSMLQTLTDLMNATYDGEFVFGGINSTSPPMSSFAGGPAEMAVNAAFAAAFGFPPSDPAAAAISGAAMKFFLDGPFAALFTSPAWEIDWSAAGPGGVTTRLGPGLVVDASTTPAKAGIAKFAEALTMVFALGEGNLSQSAFEAIADKALLLAAAAQQSLGTEQTRLGLAQEQMSSALNRYDLQSGILKRDIVAVEGVDPYEAASRVNALMSQLEMSYTLTSKLIGLSLVKFI